MVFVTVSHFRPSLTAGKAGAYLSRAPYVGVHVKGKHPALPENIRLGWK